jgi:hypothetical protein
LARLGEQIAIGSAPTTALQQDQSRPGEFLQMPDHGPDTHAQHGRQSLLAREAEALLPGKAQQTNVGEPGAGADIAPFQQVIGDYGEAASRRRLGGDFLALVINSLYGDTGHSRSPP